MQEPEGKEVTVRGGVVVGHCSQDEEGETRFGRISVVVGTWTGLAPTGRGVRWSRVLAWGDL